ncbi:MAG: ABC transporter ATP-binding protein [Candidatus Korobacteraceae bacterium]|jgi:putative spermidine/putrescine transport system ATP-binding protein
MTHLTIDRLTKQYAKSVYAVREVSLEIEKGETMVLVGPSGCGKTTTLRMTAGLEIPTSGRVLFGNKDVTDLPPEKRGVGMVFQNYALFANMTVAQNIAFGLEMRGASQERIGSQVTTMMNMMGITELAARKPAQLSGGQQQRVAFARALAIEPEYLLLDEPLTALDAKLRDNLRVELARLLKELSITALYVTHDLTEAMALGDRIAVMNDGQIQQCDTPREIYHNPANAFVAGFIGRTNCYRGLLESSDGDGLAVNLGFATLPVPCDPGSREVVVIFRPEDLRVASPDEKPHLIVHITDILFLGARVRGIGRLSGGEEIVIDLDNAVSIRSGDNVGFCIHPGKIVVRSADFNVPR